MKVTKDVFRTRPELESLGTPLPGGAEFDEQQSAHVLDQLAHVAHVEQHRHVASRRHVGRNSVRRIHSCVHGQTRKFLQADDADQPRIFR